MGEQVSSPLAELRRFHVTAQGEGPTTGAVPAALAPYRDASGVSFTWPLVVTDEASWAPFTPLADALAMAAPPGALVLRDNLGRVERHVRADGIGRPVREVLVELLPRLREELKLHEGPAADFDAAYAAMSEAFPPDAALLGYDKDAMPTLLEPVLRRHHRTGWAALEEQCHELAEKLSVLLPRTSAAEVEREVGHSSRFLDPSALAKVVGQTRRHVGDDRRARIEQTRERLMAPLDLPVVVFEGSLDDAVAKFDALAGELCQVVAAMHAARLELEGQYEPARHDDVLANLDWRGLSEGELLLLPVVIARVSGAELSTRMGELSAVLLSGRPLHVVAEVEPVADPGGSAGWRLELAYLGMALRQVWVQQSCVSRPEHVAEGLERALRSARASLHVLSAPPTGTDIAPWLVAGAGIEGRAQPLFRYDPSARAFADRVDFSGNPSPELDWPLDDRGEPFTFAHYALLHASHRRHFHPVDIDIEDDDLVPLDAWLELPPAEAAQRVPLIHAVDGDRDVRLAISRELAFATRDRLAFWRSLQELAGIHNAWAERAAAGAEQESRRRAEAELEAVREAHQAELDEAKRTAADEAMRRLTDVLLGGELLDVAAPAPSKAAAPIVGEAAEALATDGTAEAEADADAEPESDLDEDPYIDTVLCTSCNECINLNPKLFVYDANKQALIGDPDGGTYAQLVAAADACPARCIHPGKPRNPNEPDLEALTAKVAELGV
jgi:ferredoxin